MTSLLTINHFIDEANAFIESVKSTNTSYYVFTARPQPWSNTSGGDDDSAIQAVNNSIQQLEFDVYRDILYGKLLTNTDIIHTIPRYDWVSNTIYTNYDQRDANLYSKNFYVVTTDINDQYNVFKCIDNAGNSASTIKPTLQSTKGTFKTGDGYTWKFLYTVDVSSNTKFTTSQFIPITPNTEVASNAIPGTIDVIRISNSGSNYSVTETGILESIIDNITVRLPDTSSSFDNYYTNSSIYLKSGFGAGQVREIVSYNGLTKAATLANTVDSYFRLDFANSSLISGGGVGETVRQIVDTISFASSVGLFNVGDNILQTDSAVIATVLSANSSSLRVSRLNKSQTLTSNATVRSSTDVGTLKTDKANISNSTTLTLGLVVSAGSGYTGNATVTISSNTGSDGTANAQANSTGKIITINIANTGNGYATEPTVTVSAPTAQTFNSNTDVTGGTGEGSNNIIALATANVFVVGDRIRYTVSTGNTTISGLTNNTTYFVQFANDTVIALSNTANTSAGNRITLTPGITETGHTLQGITASARILPRALYATNTAASATFTSEYANGDFIRIGQDANTNIRRIESVNSTVIIVNRAFISSITSANTFKISTAALPTSISVTQANGTISNTNLDSITISITNTSVNGSLFIVGEKVKLVDSSNVSLNANGTVSYSNSSSLFISAIQGTWLSGQRVSGDSSQLIADIVTVDSRPNVTLKNPSGSFLLGQTVDFLTTTGANSGLANLVSVVDLTQNSIEYDIGPTVKITGDGTDAIAVASVNTSSGSGNTISSVTMINAGSGYTRANVEIYANTLYGSGATGVAIISPIDGHGSDVITELGGRYASITTKFNTLSNENWYYPLSVSFRKVGIIKTPEFANITITTSDYSRVSLDLSDQIGTWQANEVVVQDTSNATGIVVSGNSTVLNLKDVSGTFVQSNTLFGYTSGSTANVVTVSTVTFESGETIRQQNTGATARVSSVSGNTVYLTRITGDFSNGIVIYGETTNAHATVTNIQSSDEAKNLSTTFGDRFNQSARITLSTFTGTFQNLEYITQETTNAKGRIISKSNDLDFTISALSGSFSVGDTVINANTSANAKVTFANSTYIKVTAVSNTSLFTSNNQINNGLSANATIDSVRTVLIVSDVYGNNFLSGISTITGETSSAQGTISLVTNPDLVRNTGKVIYTEASNSVINRTENTTEEIRLTIKF